MESTTKLTNITHSNKSRQSLRQITRYLTDLRCYVRYKSNRWKFIPANSEIKSDFLWKIFSVHPPVEPSSTDLFELMIQTVIAQAITHFCLNCEYCDYLINKAYWQMQRKFHPGYYHTSEELRKQQLMGGRRLRTIRMRCPIWLASLEDNQRPPTSHNNCVAIEDLKVESNRFNNIYKAENELLFGVDESMSQYV